MAFSAAKSFTKTTPLDHLHQQFLPSKPQFLKKYDQNFIFSPQKPLYISAITNFGSRDSLVQCNAYEAGKFFFNALR